MEDDSREDITFNTPNKISRSPSYLESPHSLALNKQNSVLNQKNVRFKKYLDQEDLVVDTLKDWNNENKFYDSYIFNKLEKVMNLMPQIDHFGSSLKLQFSAERYSRSSFHLSMSNQKDYNQYSNRKGKCIDKVLFMETSTKNLWRW